MPAARAISGAGREGAGTTDELRERNLSHVLAALHRQGPLSRKELTRQLGVTRSTMGVVLADLAAMGLVIEHAPAAERSVGRPSSIHELDPAIVAVAVDVAVDAVQVATIGPSGVVSHRVRVAVDEPLSGDEVCTLVAGGLDALLDEEPRPRQVLGIGVGVPGQVRTADGTVREADHLGWRDEPLGARLAEATGLPVRVGNAAALGMRAECTFGAGRGLDDVLHVVGGSSGIGGGFLGKGGAMFAGAEGYAGEIGHTLVVPDGRACSCGATGCLEAEVTQSELLAAAGLTGAEVDDLAQRLAERRDDPALRAVVDRQSRLLGIALRNAVNLLNPSTVIAAGFLAALVAERGPTLVAEAIRSSRDDLRLVPVVTTAPAQVLIGAAELVFDDLIAAPSRGSVRC